MRNRVVTLLAASALLAGGSVTLGASNAAAATWTFEKSSVASDGSFTITAYNSGTNAGTMEWNGDPVGSQPGDAFRVTDRLADGRGMEASMISPVNDRVATTRGYASPYTSPWNTGDLTEDTTVFIQLCAVAGLNESCSAAYSGHA
ncbi:MULTISPECIES: hypothetical protein [unclassified Streptomyces]|uniref:hypothetical protein n=1 Tax=unclassified Streptomyces TaxID=2593676 RepID=UPI002DD9FA11|nr:hypothetical protein [Streptomyces sp. NBC_00243]WRZ22798.1 hypothetical protein OHT59_32135 [Streptomyces sp. NBC_00243]